MNSTGTVERVQQAQSRDNIVFGNFGDHIIVPFRKKRDLDVDALKGVAILLVVLGHAIQANTPYVDGDIVFRVIYSFHMPLFMFLSGYIVFNRPINLVKKFKSLVIPFVSWYLMWYFIAGVYRSTTFGDYVAHLYKPPDDRLWFLWILFLNFCILSVVLRLWPLRSDFAILLAIVMTKLIPVDMDVMDIPLLRWYFLFFACGYLIAKHRNRVKSLKWPVRAMALLAFPVLVSFWYRLDPPSFTPALYDTLGLDDNGANAVLFIYSMIVPLAGIAVIFWVISILRRFDVYKVLGWLGLLSLDIYVSHQFFLFVLRPSIGTGVLRVASAFVCGLLLSLAFGFFVRKTKLPNALLLGNRETRVPGPGLRQISRLASTIASVSLITSCLASLAQILQHVSDSGA